MSNRRLKGFSLVEVLLAAALLLTLFILSIDVLLPMAQGARKGSQQIQLQQLAQLAMEQMTHDLACAPGAGLTFVAPTGSPAVLSVQRLADVTTTGGQKWSDTLSVYWLSQGRLFHRDWPPAPPALRVVAPDVPFAPTQDELLQIAASGGRVLAPSVETWEVDLAAGPPRLRLVLSAQGERFELTRRQVLVNQQF